MREWLFDVFRERPWWMSATMIFCAYMAFVYMPWDIFVKPVAKDEEVWFGILFTGTWAKILAFPHWFVYGAAVIGQGLTTDDMYALRAFVERIAHGE